ncbi:MAG: peptide ABC transporter substrate-binding protein, partial [Dehalococcoidales bacterium]
TDDDRALALYQQAEELLVEDAACLPLCFGRSYLLVKPYVKGYEPNPLGFVRLEKVSVEEH